MVSGFVTSPCDQERIFSGLARRILIASNSIATRPGSGLCLFGSIKLIWFPRPLRFQKPSVLRLDQFHVQAQALQLADQNVERFRQPWREHGVALDDGLVD